MRVRRAIRDLGVRREDGSSMPSGAFSGSVSMACWSFEMIDVNSFFIESEDAVSSLRE